MQIWTGMMVRESHIRDKLAMRLDLIDPNLDLVAKEFHIENLHGTDGFIDILARDRVHQQLVVVELKKSNQTARQAIHELIKYASLLRAKHGFSNANIRAVLISTEWSELIVPFSAFVRETPFHVEGFRLVVSENGDPQTADAIVPIPEAAILELNPSRCLYLFSTEEDRDLSVAPLIRAFREAGFIDFLAITLDYAGDSARVIFPRGIYVATSRLDENARMQMRSEFGNDCDFDDIAEELNPWIYEDEACGKVWELFQEQPQGSALGDFECSYPEQFGRILSDWKCGLTQRFGRWQDTLLISEQDIQRALTGVDGVNNELFIQCSSPKFAASWDDFLKGCNQILAVNDVWRKNLLGYFRTEVKLNSTVSISMHCPDNIVGVVTGVAVYGKPVILPWLDAVVTDESSSKFLRGSLRWTGGFPHPDARTFFDQQFGSLGEVLMRRLVGDYSAEPQILSWLNLEYFLFECTQSTGETEPIYRELFFQSGKLQFRPFERANEQNNMLEYFKSNANLLIQLNDLVSEYVLGEQLPVTKWIDSFLEG